MLIIILQMGTSPFCSSSLSLDYTLISMGEIQDGCTMTKVYRMSLATAVAVAVQPNSKYFPLCKMQMVVALIIEQGEF